ncbi:Mycothiol acetyltransferase [Streptomyces sp. RB5]|uniref:Mycothiol acetyltransferase n=1 Tax=Streptomyces smaragdinus TaxID=2585196 RepID=A0A7K0CIA1_9ACTN|nr:GNAT family N-acetyltransferase [Streptomyces smaragdinus]MQY13198.1 Mycothiol acetyltransferase [Streptomyces smaragdinus]
MPLIIRDFRPGDAPAVMAVRRAAVPFLVQTPEALAESVAGAPAAQRLRLLVAEADGVVVGAGQTGLQHDTSEPGQAFANPQVHPDHRRAGAGGALLAEAERYVRGFGVVRMHSWVMDEEPSRSFAEHRGYASSRVAHVLRLDLAHAPLPPAAPPSGTQLRPLGSFRGDPRPLFALECQTVEDEPGDVASDAMDFDDWFADTFVHGGIDQELSTVVVVDGVPAAHSYVETDGRTRLASRGTGTGRAYRGRGLATLAKIDSLGRARAAGITDAFTGNDDSNAPMLAVNRRLGYRRFAGERRYVRDL